MSSRNHGNKVENQAVSPTAANACFPFSKGRFVQNEAWEMSQHQVSFNMRELSRIASRAVGSQNCTKVEKYTDGMFNKTFLFTMSDGKEAVGKVPNPNAGRPHFTISSEVATMDFVRNVLGIPAPEVYVWNSNARNPAGVEYIIMQRAPGIQLANIWPNLELSTRLEIVKKLAKYQTSFLSASFKGIGALYYARDLKDTSSMDCVFLEEKEIERHDSRFRIGPCTSREFTDDGRVSVSFDRGPWTSAEEYRVAIGHREIACIRELPQLPKSPLSLRGPGAYQPNRAKKIAAIKNYIALVKYLLPGDNSITRSCLWHSSLHAENIYVNPEDPVEITGVIDWQCTDILPLFDHSLQLPILQYDGPSVNGLEEPSFPEHFKDLSLEEKQQARTLFRNMSMMSLYNHMTHDRNPRLYRAMEFRETLSFELLLYPRHMLIDGEAHYRALVAELKNRWSELPGVQAHGDPPFPFHFSPAELALIHDDANAADYGMQYMDIVKQRLGDLFPEQGIVRHDRYEATKQALMVAKRELIEELHLEGQERVKWEKAWPFDN